MRRHQTTIMSVSLSVLLTIAVSSCGSYTNVFKSNDPDFRYEAAKAYFATGQYNRSSTLLNDLITILKGSPKGEESVYMLGMSYYNDRDYSMAAQTFQQYYAVYPRGKYVERSRFYAGKAMYLDSPETRLDQTDTYSAIQELQVFIEYYPESQYRDEAQDMIFQMQDKLVEKELLASELYYNLGTYLGNNYESCVITAQNALKDYPYTHFREDLSLLVLRAKYALAQNSVEDKRIDRYREAADESYAFKNEFPESENVKLADEILEKTEKVLAGVSEDE